MSRYFNFWKGWLFYSSLLFALFGVMLALNSENSVFYCYFNALEKVFLIFKINPSESEKFRSFVAGPLGGTIACAYVVLAYLAWFPFARKERWARNAIIAGFGLWYILDSAVCILYGVYFQVYMINTFSLLQKALPIIFTWRDFK